MTSDVPYVKQFNRSSCVAACFEMVFAFYGFKVSQRALYKKAEPTSRGLPYPDLMLALKDKNFRLERWSNHKSVYNRARTEKAKKLGLIRFHSKANLPLLKSFLKKGMPVIIGVHLDTWKNQKLYGGDTHAVVIVGYRNNKFIVNDPATGPRWKGFKVSPKHLKTAWDKCDNTMSILIKK